MGNSNAIHWVYVELLERAGEFWVVKAGVTTAGGERREDPLRVYRSGGLVSRHAARTAAFLYTQHVAEVLGLKAWA